MFATQEKPYNVIEEVFNSLTHGIGVLVSIATLVLLVVYAKSHGNANHVVSFTIFGGTLGWTILGVIWLLALAGVVLKVYFVHRFIIISTIAYVLMGWIIVLAIKPLVDSLPWGGSVCHFFAVFFYVLPLS
jgi:hemolysin III